MQEQNKIDMHKDVVDSFNGPAFMAHYFGWNVSTVYLWLRGKEIGLSHAICITSERPQFSIEDLTSKTLTCDQIYIDVVAFFGSQSNTAQALGITQPSVNGWLFNKAKISLEKAERLEEVTQGRFHPSDFPHLVAAA